MASSSFAYAVILLLVAAVVLALALRGPAGSEPLRWRNAWRLSDYLGGPVNAAPPGPSAGGPPIDRDDALDQRFTDPLDAAQPGASGPEAAPRTVM